MQSRGSQVQLPSFCPPFCATARHLRCSPATLTIIIVANRRAETELVWHLVTLICFLLPASIHNSTRRSNGSLSIIAYFPHANIADATLQCMLGEDVVLFYLPSHARRPVSQLIGIRCCYVVGAIHREQDSATNTLSPSYLI